MRLRIPSYAAAAALLAAPVLVGCQSHVQAVCEANPWSSTAEVRIAEAPGVDSSDSTTTYLGYDSRRSYSYAEIARSEGFLKFVVEKVAPSPTISARQLARQTTATQATLPGAGAAATTDLSLTVVAKDPADAELLARTEAETFVNYLSNVEGGPLDPTALPPSEAQRVVCSR